MKTRYATAAATAANGTANLGNTTMPMTHRDLMGLMGIMGDYASVIDCYLQPLEITTITDSIRW